MAILSAWGACPEWPRVTRVPKPIRTVVKKPIA